MAANTVPVFVATPQSKQAQATAANTNRDGTGTLITLYTAGSNGSRIDRITGNATVTTAAGMIRIFLNDGTHTWLWKELTTAAVTPSGTVAAATIAEQVRTDGLPIVDLPSGWSIMFAPNNAETWNLQCYGGDY